MWRTLENDPREIRAAAVDAQRISDWLMARERERTVEPEQPAPELANRGEGPAPTTEREPMPARVGNAGGTGGRAVAGRRTQPVIGVLSFVDPVRRTALRATRPGRAVETACPFPEGKMSRERPAREV